MTDRREPASGHGDHIVFDGPLDPDDYGPDDYGPDEHRSADLDDQHWFGDHDGHRDSHHDDGHNGYGHNGYHDEGYHDDHPLAHLEPLEPPERRRDRLHRKERRGGRAVRRLLVFVVAIGLIGAAAFAAVAVLRPVVSGFGSGSNDYAGPGSGAVEITVNPGDTGRAIGQNLETLGVVKSAKAFSDAASDNAASAGIQPGEYTMKKEMKASDAVTWLVDPANRSAPTITIPEGRWKSEVFALLSKGTGRPVADYEAAAKDTNALGLPASAKGNVEGFLFPATYEFSKDTTPAQQLRTMVQKAIATLSSVGVTSDNMGQAVITASILEAEGKTTADREKIAQVLLNRIAQNKALQLDSTVSYGVQKRGVTTTDAERSDKNPYNTYVVTGLPAGPIGNPGQSAMEASQHPADGPWLFFVTVNPSTGETKFTTTPEEHDQYVKEFQAWCQANPGQC